MGDDARLAELAAATWAARAATRLRRIALREDERLAESVDDARHTATVEAGRGATMANPEDGAQRAGAMHPDAYLRLLRESTRLREERAALRAAVARAEGELDERDRDWKAAVARLEAERDAARAALVEETARRLWAEGEMDALAVRIARVPNRWEWVGAILWDVWRDRARAELAERGRAATGAGDGEH